MAAEGGHGFNWFHAFHVDKLGETDAIHIVGAVLVAGGLFFATWIARAQLFRVMQSPEGALIPDSKLTFRNFFEIAAEQLYELVKSVMGPSDAAKFYPFIGSLFLFIFANNILGLIPGFLPPTENINTTLALGTFVFLYYNWVGIKEHGFSYVKQFFGPVLLLAPLMLVIELVSHIVRPLSLGLRLRGNIMGDHMVLSAFLDMAPVLIPVVFYGLGVFVCFIQAFVFCLLTMIYINLAKSHDH